MGYTTCTKTCGLDGEQVRYRNCKFNQTIVDVAKCPGSEASASQSQPCNESACRKYFFRFKINSTYWLAGTFIWEKDGDKIQFTECPAGFNCAKPDAIYHCSDGTFSDASATICLTCTPGSFCQNGITEKCPPGTAADDEGLIECLECPIGMNCANPIEPTICPCGQYTAESKTSCLICSSGNYCSGGIIRTCISGKDCSEEGQAQVSLTSNVDLQIHDLEVNDRSSLIYKENDCRRGYQCSDPGNPQACRAGTFNGDLNAINCDHCSIGTNCSRTGETHERECAVGFECSDPAYPKQCLSGSLATSLNQTECLSCPFNYDCSIPTNPVFIAPSIVQGENTEISSCSKSLFLKSKKSQCLRLSPFTYGI